MALEDIAVTAEVPGQGRTDGQTYGGELRIKHNLLHVWIKHCEEALPHYLVPTYSERMLAQPKTRPGSDEQLCRSETLDIYKDHFDFQSHQIDGEISPSDDVIKAQFDERMVSHDSGYGSVSGSFYRSSFISLDEEKELDASEYDKDDESNDVGEEASVGLLPNSFTESISVAVVERTPCLTYASEYGRHRATRFIEGVIYGLGHKPGNFQEKLVVFKNLTKRKFRSSLCLSQKPKVLGFRESCILRSQTEQTTVASLLEYGQQSKPRWFRESVTMWPQSCASARISSLERNNNNVKFMEQKDNNPYTPATPDDVFEKMGRRVLGEKTMSSSLSVHA